jgi:phosphoglycerate kinase
MATATNGEIRYFRDAEVKRGERWIYSADFNVKDTVSPHRVDEEISDIRRISDAGGITVILAHEGRYGKTKSLEFVADYLSEKLNRKVHYHMSPVYGRSVGFLGNADAAIEFVEKMKPGEIALMGNVRDNEGEEWNSPELGYLYAQLGDKVAVGGFGKAHRKHASNVGLLDYRSGYLSSSQEEQMKKLESWKGRDPSRYSVAVLGGVKGEKITYGLAGFAEIYDTIIPGGIVLNTILKCMYKQAGISVLKDKGKSFESEVEKVLEKYPVEKYPDKIIVPKEVVVAWPEGDHFGYIGSIHLDIESIPEDSMVVGYKMPFDAQCALGKVAQEKGRLVVAGTPDIPSIKESKASYQLNSWLPQIGKNALILGGDTARDLEAKDAVISTGGGSALMYLTTGTTHVYEKLKENFRERGR